MKTPSTTGDAGVSDVETLKGLLEPMTPAHGIRALIEAAEKWRAQHVAAKRGVEALACNIRIKALKDALVLVEGQPR